MSLANAGAGGVVLDDAVRTQQELFACPCLDIPVAFPASTCEGDNVFVDDGDVHEEEVAVLRDVGRGVVHNACSQTCQ